MRKVLLAIWTLMCFSALCAQSVDTEVRSLVIKTTDNNVIRINLADIEEISFASEEVQPSEPVTITSLINLTPEFLSIVDLEENQTLLSGEVTTITLKAGDVLNGTFQDYHFQHVHLQVNGEVIVPTLPEDYVPTDEMKISFTVPSEDCQIVVCYSVQQQLLEDGYTMTLEPNPNVTLFGVSPELKYKYFDAYLLTDDAFVITNAEFKMGDGQWQPVNGTVGCSLTPSQSVENVYNVTIRPDYENVTGDVLLRVFGEQHHRFTITWVNADAKYLDLELSSLPTDALDGEKVTAELFIKKGYYLKDATSNNTEVSVLYGAYVSFKMPEENTTITLDIQETIPVSLVESEHVVSAEIYDAPDIYYGVPITTAAPGTLVYIIAQAEPGYKPMTATTNDGSTFVFSHYGLDMYVCPVIVPSDVTSFSASISCSQAWTVTSEQTIQCMDGELYAQGEKVSLSIQVPNGKKIQSVKVTTAGGEEVPADVEAPYVSFVMPAADVKVEVTFADIEVGNTVSVKAYYDEDHYIVSSSTNYDWDFAEGFQIDKDATIYLSVYDYSGGMFYVGVKIGDNVQIYPATQDEETGEFTFGKALTATADVTIKVGASESSVVFDDNGQGNTNPETNTVKVVAYYDQDQYRVSSSTNYDWDFAEGFTKDKDASFYLSVYDDYGEKFYVGVKIGDKVQIYAATEDEETGEYTFGKSFTATCDVTIKVGATEESVAFEDNGQGNTNPEIKTVKVIAYYDQDQYSVRSSTNYDWDFAEGFTLNKDSTFYLSVYDDYGEMFYVGVLIGDDLQIYPATEDEETGEYTFGKSITATADVTITVGPTESSVEL